MKTTVHHALWVALLTICLAATVGARDIKIGMVLPLSGGGAQFGDQIEKGAMLYYNLHKADLGDNRITLIKRDSKNPGGSVSKAVTQELIVREKVRLDHRLCLLAQRHFYRAASHQGGHPGGDYECEDGMDHQSVAQHCPRVVYHVAIGLTLWASTPPTKWAANRRFPAIPIFRRAKTA